MSGQSSGLSAPFAKELPHTTDRRESSTPDPAARQPQSDASIATNLAQDGPLQRRHRPRGSGSFLLQTTSALEPDTVPDVKGKRKAEEGDLVVPKRASARQRHRQKSSLGSSPLATEVVNVHSSEHPGGYGASEAAKRSSFQSDNRQIMPSSVNSNHLSAESAAATDPSLLSKGRNAISNDTDAAQIVNLALSLSNSRRRNFSSGTMLLPRDGVGTRRIISSGQQTLGLPYGASGGSLRQQLQNQRQVSRNSSPRSGRSGVSPSEKPTGPDSPNLHNDQAGKRQSAVSHAFNPGVPDDFVFDASDATLSRAEKARVAIEMMYEYRRLLQYLPPIPTNSKRKLATGKDVGDYQGERSDCLGRTYNPLQYIRNRKVRFRERRPLDPEAAGWKNLDRVRAWVDTVANEREDGLSRIDRRFPLPSLDTISIEHPLADGLQNTSVPDSASSQNRKVERPRMDWEFGPWDLLADAYWLDQDDNLDHIEDQSGKRIIMGYLDRKDHKPRRSMDSDRSSVGRSESIFREHTSPDRVRALAGHSRKDSKDRRGRRSLDVYELRSPASEDNGSRERKSRWTKKLVRTRSSSNSDDSRHESGRKYQRGRDYADSHEHLESAVLEKQMMDMLAKEAEAKRQVGQSPEVDTYNKADSSLRPAVGGMRAKVEQRDTKRRPSAPQRMRTDLPVTAKHSISPRASLDEDRFHHRRISSDDLDLTAPSSPMAPGFVPSIAINLSPPASPPSTVSSPQKSLALRTGSSRRDRSQSTDRPAINDIDPDPNGMTDLSRQTTKHSQKGSASGKGRFADSSNGSFSPVRIEAAGNKTRPLNGNPIRSIKNANVSDSRLRGLFKGGRIAELVGSEVSRVGDMFWRKDNSHASRVASPVSSYAPSDESDLDDGEMSVSASSPKNDLSRATTRDDGSLSRVSTNSEKPRYYMSNLPSFRSSTHRDEQSPQSTKATPNHDHITRQQLAQRERGRSSRFDRLAPPKMDMRGISLPSSREHSPAPSQSRRTYDEGSRHSSSSRSDRQVRSADRRLNLVLGIPGKSGTGHVPPTTGLAGLDSKARESPQRPDLESKRQWSISDQSVSTVRGTVNKRDIARVRALLLSSGVKANEIARRAEEVPEKPTPLLQELQSMFKGPIPRVPRSQEALLAARITISTIEANTQDLRDETNYFTHTTTEKLLTQIKDINERVTCKLTPLVRDCADDADALGTELTTTHTLAIKQLNDSINLILRRRRRRLRYSRRMVWAAVEWTLLGVMWIVWLLVVIIRIARGTVGGMVKSLRWLFWL